MNTEFYRSPMCGLKVFGAMILICIFKKIILILNLVYSANNNNTYNNVYDDDKYAGGYRRKF